MATDGGSRSLDINSGKLATLNSIGLEVPSSFPATAHDAVHEATNTAFRTLQVRDDLQGGFRGAWNAIAYRYVSCTEYSASFSESVAEHGAAPHQPERYMQERDFFNFIVTGLACFEAFHYALYCIGAVLQPNHFPYETASDRRRITPGATRELFARHYPSNGVTHAVIECLTSTEYDEWARVRNVLAHRGLPGRQIFASVGGGENGGRYHPFEDVSIEINAETTTTFLGWLRQTLERLLSEMRTFVERELS